MNKQEWLRQEFDKLDLIFTYFDEDNKNLMDNIIPNIEIYKNGFIIYFEVKLIDRHRVTVEVGKYTFEDGFFDWNEDCPLKLDEIKKLTEIIEKYKEM